MKSTQLDHDRESLVQVRRIYRIADGGHIPIIHAVSGDGFYHTVWQCRLFRTMGNSFHSLTQPIPNKSIGQLTISHTL